MTSLSLPAPGPSRPGSARTRPGWARTLVAALGFTMLVAGGGLREDELECEEAVAHLQDCCPGFADATLQCVHSDYCTHTEPALFIDESTCILARSCDEVIQSGICQKTHDLESPGTDFDGNVITHAAVCP